MAFLIKPKQTVVFIGDSITDCGRRGDRAPLGDGYVKLANDLITARYPAHRLNINTGIGGNTVRDLAGRWHDDVVRHKPDVLSIKIGINDLFSWLNKDPDRSVSPQEFTEIYDRVLDRTRRQTKAGVVLVDPFFISTERDRSTHRGKVLEHLPAYIRTVHAMAKKSRARLVRTHEQFQALLKNYPPDHFCPEPVHPYTTGHMVIAHAWLKTMGW